MILVFGNHQCRAIGWGHPAWVFFTLPVEVEPPVEPPVSGPSFICAEVAPARYPRVIVQESDCARPLMRPDDGYIRRAKIGPVTNYEP